MAATFLAHILMILAIAISTSFFLLYFFSNKKGNTRNWPIFGILPSLLLNFHRFPDKITEILEENNGTILVKCKRFANKNILFTSDPANVQHIMSTNFSNYPKGSDWRERFDIFGCAVFNIDFDEWAYQRKVARALLSNHQTLQFMGKILRNCVENELIPIFDRATKQAHAVDLQLLFQKVTFYFATNISVGNCNKLSDFLEEDPFNKALDDACEAIFLRYFLPERFWKLQRWLGFGKEKKLSKARNVFYHTFEEYLSLKKYQLNNSNNRHEDDFSALKLYMVEHEIMGPRPTPYNVMRDNIISLIFATGDTTTSTLSWFFWLLSQNPNVETKISQELERVVQKEKREETQNFGTFSTEELTKMVYLQAALMETLRLYPPAPYQSRSPMEDDTLPSGHKINKEETRVWIATYTMGRMESVWGEDCKEFKPERWITEDGKIRHEAAHKMFAFNAGPRICPGKDIAWIMMKTFAATIIQKYSVQVVEHQNISAKPSIILQLKCGLMVRIKSLGEKVHT